MHSPIFGVYTPGIEALDIDNLCLEAFRCCEAKYWRQIYQGLVSNEEAVALAFGKALHAGRAIYRITKTDKEATPDFCLELGLGAIQQEWHASMPPEMKTDVMANDRRSLANAKKLFTGYAEKYLQHGEPLSVEVVDDSYLGKSPEFGIEVYYHYAIDELCLFDGKKRTREVKTTSYPPETQLAQFQTSAAISGYIWGASHYFNEPIYSSIVDLIWVHNEPEKKTAKTVPFKNYFKMDIVYRSQDQLDLWKRNTLVTVDDIVRATKRGYFRFDFGKACTLFNKCPYYDIHSASPDSWDDLIKMGYHEKRWSPYDR